MAKLYPPTIEGTLPAWTGTEVSVPFAMNSSVSINEIQGLELKIRTVQNDMFICTLDSTSYIRQAGTNYIANFTISEKYQEKIKVGAYYKCQLAYVQLDGDIGYYSTVGVVKRTSEPTVSIEGLETMSSNQMLRDYIGVYKQEDDTTEKVYSYSFKLYDENKNLLLDTGELLHNSTEDVSPSESHDNFTLEYNVEPATVYYLQYSVITRNSLEVSTSKYKLIEFATVPADIGGYLCAQNNYENAYIELFFRDKETSDGVVRPVSGMFEVSRKEDSGWEPIGTFKVDGAKPSDISYKDLTIEHGKTYSYSIRQYNNDGVYSSRQILENVVDGNGTYTATSTIVADFEDSFLYDGESQLKIRFNPQVSTFKETVLESKIDTLGGQYPTFFRNQFTKYKEFQLSGLLSYWSDEDELFQP